MTEDQSRMLELLCLFRDICERHGLKYFIMGGTLLGAVRHRGFIPWDDDVDVAMPAGDLERFAGFAGELPEYIRIQSEPSDPKYPFVFIKLCDTRFPFSTGCPNSPLGVYIDIFPLIPAKALNRRTKLLFSMINVSNYVLQVKLDWSDFIPYKKLTARAGFRLMSLLSVKRLRKLRRLLIMGIYSSTDSGVLCSPGGAYKADKEFFPAEWFEKTEKLSFEGETLDAPKNWDSYLSRNYGEYMKLPPEEERRSSHKK